MKYNVSLMRAYFKTLNLWKYVTSVSYGPSIFTQLTAWLDF